MDEFKEDSRPCQGDFKDENEILYYVTGDASRGMMLFDSLL